MRTVTRRVIDMTIDEVIAKYKEKAKFFKQTTNVAYALELEQLTEWLEELKAIKSDGFTDNLLNMGFAKGYNKAIDDFVENISLEISESIIWDMIATMNKNSSLSDTSDKIVDYVINTANEIAKQLKAD